MEILYRLVTLLPKIPTTLWDSSQNLPITWESATAFNGVLLEPYLDQGYGVLRAYMQPHNLGDTWGQSASVLGLICVLVAAQYFLHSN